MMNRTPRIVAGLAIAIAIFVCLAGCAGGGGVSEIWLDDREDFIDTIVVDTLLPRYASHPDTTPDDIANVQGAIQDARDLIQIHRDHLANQ